MISAVLAVTVTFAAQAQTGASRLMLAAVTDPRGHSLVDIGADDFAVQEEGAAREILSVRVADYPIVVLVDAAAGSPDDFALMQTAAAHFIERLGNDRPVIVGTLAHPPRLLTTFEDDRKTVLERLRALTPASAAAPALEGIAVAAQTLRATGSLFSSIVVLSAAAAGDTSAAPPETIAPIVESSAIVHVIASRPSTGVDRSLGTLQAIVSQTRGEFTPIYSAASFQAALDRLVDRLSSEMLIEYLVPPGTKPVDAKVGIRVPGARVRGLGVAPR